MATSKPNLTRVWASGAPGTNVIDPDTTTPGKFSAGWLAEVPPFEHFNFLQKLFTQGLAHNNEQGINIWDSTTVYPLGALVKGSNGKVYEAVSEQSGNDPVLNSGTHWVLWEIGKFNLNFSSVSEMLSNSLGRINSETRRVTISSGVWLVSTSSSGLAQVGAISNTSPQLYARPLNGVWADDFGPIVNNTDCVATINSCMSYLGTLKANIKVPYVGTINVDSVSVLFQRNKTVDLGGNTFKLANGASKYVFSQSDLSNDDFITSNGGTLEIFNFHIDGNARGGQTRNLVGTDARDMYCGFAALFFGLRSLKLYNFKFTDTEAWAVAYFKCRDVECHTGEFDQDQTRIGFNGDGITGIASRVHLWNLSGYTNDDFVAVTTTRASIGGVQIWNDGINVESVNVHDIELIDKVGKSPHFAVGLYPSDSRTIAQVTIGNVSGNCENGLWRAGNYFSSLGALNGTISHISERNLNGHSKTLNHGQRLIFKCTVGLYSCSEAYNNNTAIAANNQFLKLQEAIVNTLTVSDSIYQQTFTPGSRQGVIHVDSNSHIKNLNVSNFFHSLTASQLATPERFTFLENLGGRPRVSMSSVTKGDATDGNLNFKKDDYWVSGNGIVAGNLNIHFSDDLVLNSANYTEVQDLVAHFDSGFVTYRGAIQSGATITAPSELGVLTRPAWAKPFGADMFTTNLFVSSEGSSSPQACTVVYRNASTSIDLFNISGSPTTSFLSITGTRFRVDPVLP